MDVTITPWRDCDSAGKPHLWLQREVSPLATSETRAHAERDGWFVCARKECPAAGFGPLERLRTR